MFPEPRYGRLCGHSRKIYEKSVKKAGSGGESENPYLLGDIPGADQRYQEYRQEPITDVRHAVGSVLQMLDIPPGRITDIIPVEDHDKRMNE